MTYELTPRSVELLRELPNVTLGNGQVVRGPEWAAHLEAIERAAVARALSVERLAEALNATVGKYGWLRSTPSDPPTEWYVNAERVLAALTESDQ